jgi:hypothetical protein
MILSNEEKLALKKIAALSTKDETVVKEVLFALLAYATLEAYNNKNEGEIILPYIAKLNLKYKEEPAANGYSASVDIEAKALSPLIQEFVCLKNGEDPPSKKYFKKMIKKIINKKLYQPME